VVVILSYTLLAISLLLAIVKPRWAFLLYIVAAGWTPAGMAQNIVGMLDYDDVSLFVVAVAALRFIVFNARACWTPVTKILLAYWLFSLVGNAIGVTKDPSIVGAVARQMAKDFSLLLYFSALSGCLWDKAFFRKAAIAMAVATIGVVASVYVDRFFPHHPITRFWIHMPMSGDRTTGMFVTPYLAGAYLVIGIDFVLAYYLYSNSAWKKPVLAGVSVVYGIALLFGQSRASYMAVVVILLVAMLSRVRNFIWGVLFAGVLAGVILSNSVLMEHLVGRFQGQHVEALGGRALSWRMWLGTMDDVSWILGNGFQYSVAKSGTAGHSAYMDAYADGGVGGLIALLAFWPLVLRARKRFAVAPLSDGDKAKAMALCWCAIAFLISSAMLGFVTDTYYRTVFLTVLTLALAPCLTAAYPSPQYVLQPRLVRRPAM
jgi:hypothetical protein